VLGAWWVHLTGHLEGVEPSSSRCAWQASVPIVAIGTPECSLEVLGTYYQSLRAAWDCPQRQRRLQPTCLVLDCVEVTQCGKLASELASCGTVYSRTDGACRWCCGFGSEKAELSTFFGLGWRYVNLTQEHGPGERPSESHSHMA
jgi:hypothetical protein